MKALSFKFLCAAPTIWGAPFSGTTVCTKWVCPRQLLACGSQISAQLLTQNCALRVCRLLRDQNALCGLCGVPVVAKQSTPASLYFLLCPAHANIKRRVVSIFYISSACVCMCIKQCFENVSRPAEKGEFAQWKLVCVAGVQGVVAIYHKIVERQRKNTNYQTGFNMQMGLMTEIININSEWAESDATAARKIP